jgi:hypothetical protein
MTATEFLDIENKDLKKELEKHLLRNKVTGVMRAFAEAYHQEKMRENRDCNMQDIIHYYLSSKHIFTDKVIDVLEEYLKKSE